jgi:hypothetical protein
MILIAGQLRAHVEVADIADWKWQVLGFFGITTILVNLYFFLKIARWI